MLAGLVLSFDVYSLRKVHPPNRRGMRVSFVHEANSLTGHTVDALGDSGMASESLRDPRKSLLCKKSPIKIALVIVYFIF